jgi:MarR family transcriptional regulator for hemolysin
MHDGTDRDSIGFVIASTARRMRVRLDERLAPLDLTQARWVTLHNLAGAGGSLPQRELVVLVGVEGPSLVKVLDGLERLGMIERRDCPADRRAKTVHLTDKAKPVIGEIARRAAALRAEMLNGIADQDIAICRNVLSRISRNLGKPEP